MPTSSTVERSLSESQRTPNPTPRLDGIFVSRPTPMPDFRLESTPLPVAAARLFSAVAFALLLVLCGCGMQVKQPEARVTSRKPALSDRSAPSSATAESAQAPSDTKPPTSAVSTDAPSSVDAPSADRVAPTASNGRPRLVADQTVHHFGAMNPRTNGKHTFLVRNEGNADLLFLHRRSSCDCTVGWFPKDPVRPGETAEILVQWHTRLDHGRFRQTTTVTTNDPQQPELEFAIEGDVLTHVGAEPPQLGAEDIRPGEARTFTSVVSSQVWKDFEISDLETSLDGLQWSVQPATDEQRAAHRAVKAYELTVTIPESMPVGPFHHWVRLRIDPKQDGLEADTYELPLQGKVLRNLAVYGPGIDSTGTLDLGVIPSRSGLKRRLILKVYDRDYELNCTKLESTPDFLKLTVHSATPDGPSKGVYYLDIEVPAGSPDCNFVRGAAGRLRLTFDHPRISTLELNLLMAVARDASAPPTASVLRHAVPSPATIASEASTPESSRDLTFRTPTVR